jgi:hypothetical protein
MSLAPCEKRPLDCDPNSLVLGVEEMKADVCMVIHLRRLVVVGIHADLCLSLSIYIYIYNIIIYIYIHIHK